jgi:hypothetical protein
MLELLNTNLPPLKTSSKTFQETFDELLFECDRLRIASGYITADSIVELQRTVELNRKPGIELIIGMHFFDRFTRKEYEASVGFNNYLLFNKVGRLYLSTAFRYHGKVYSFLKEGKPFASIVGSNNLSSITEYGRVYETSVLFEDKSTSLELDNLISELIRVSKPLELCQITSFKEYNQSLEGHEGVQKETAVPRLSDTHFLIPLKVGDSYGKSNLNAFFGKGREDKRGLIKPRHWYEIEIIVPSEITSRPNYPKSENETDMFDVVTDDGWKFKCKVSGDYNKNFRSEGDLKILGKWIKGRLENAGALKVGELVTEETLRKYGRSDFKLIKTVTDGLWYLDFGVR